MALEGGEERGGRDDIIIKKHDIIVSTPAKCKFVMRKKNHIRVRAPVPHVGVAMVSRTKENPHWTTQCLKQV